MSVKATRESDIVRACLDWLALHRILAWRANNTGIFDQRRGRYRTFHGLAGVADILGCVQWDTSVVPGIEATFGVLLAVEVKKPGRKPTAAQAQFLADVNDRGGIGLCVHSTGELEEKLKERGVL